jgi:hypothetical protein
VTLHRAYGQPIGLTPIGGVDLQNLLRCPAAIFRVVTVQGSSSRLIREKATSSACSGFLTAFA